MGDADTGADPHFLTGQGERLAQDVHDPPPDRDGMGRMPRQYRELVTAQSRGRVPSRTQPSSRCAAIRSNSSP